MRSNILITFTFLLSILLFLIFESCSKDDDMIPVPMTEQFESLLSTYNIYQGNIQDLIPSNDYHLLELNSSLFVNYAEKQRLVKLPTSEQMTHNGNGIPNFSEWYNFSKNVFLL